MNPTIKKCAIFAATLMSSLFLCNCSESDNSNNSYAMSGNANVKLALKYNAPPLLDSLVLDCYGPDTLHLVHSTGDSVFSVELFASDNWNFKAKIYANGALMQMGEIQQKVEPGKAAEISIQMHPLVGFVYVEIPLGLKNRIGISSGTMSLKSATDSSTVQMQIENGSAVFKSGMLKLNATFNVQISLFDANGNEMFNLADSFLLTEDSPVPSLTLNSLRSNVALTVLAAAERNVSITLPLRSISRTPEVDDILITEFYGGLNKSETDYEFVEIYNGSLDTLMLNDCSLGILGSTKKYVSITRDRIYPNEALVLGDTNSITPPAFYNTNGWAHIINTKGSIVIKCGGVTIDSLYHTTSSDTTAVNFVPNADKKKNLSSQLNIDNWTTRTDSSAWCLNAPTPGELSFCAD